MKIFSMYTCTGKEWKPCIECGKVFEHGEIKHAIEHGNGCMVTSFYCRKCVARYFPKFGYMGDSGESKGQLMVIKKGKLVPAYQEVNPFLWDVDLKYREHRLDRLLELEKFSDCSRYMEFNNIGCYSMN